MFVKISSATNKTDNLLLDDKCLVSFEIKFSVLMSVYYKEKPEYLKQALDSVFNQTLKPNEEVEIKNKKVL